MIIRLVVVYNPLWKLLFNSTFLEDHTRWGRLFFGVHRNKNSKCIKTEIASLRMPLNKTWSID